MIYEVASWLISLEVFFFLPLPYLVAGSPIHLQEWWGAFAPYAKRIKAKWGVYYSNLVDNPLAKDRRPLTKQIKICHCDCHRLDNGTRFTFPGRKRARARRLGPYTHPYTRAHSSSGSFGPKLRVRTPTQVMRSFRTLATYLHRLSPCQCTS